MSTFTMPRAVVAALVAPLVAVLALVLGACTSIPISTLYKLSQLTEAEIEDLDPTAIRTVIEVPENVGIDAAKLTVGIKVTSPSARQAGIESGAWPVQQVASGRYVPLPIRPSEAGRRQVLFKLMPEAETRLAAVLADIKAHPDPATKVAINIDLSDVFVPPPGSASFKASAWLQLRQVDGPLLLIDDASFDAGAAKKP